MHLRHWMLIVAGCSLFAPRAAEAGPAATTAPAGRPAEKTLMVVSGLVTLDGKPAENIRVTDGVIFTATDKAGRYSIGIKPTESTPFLPSRTVSVCWPSNTWPVKDEKTGHWSWWARVKAMKDPRNVNFQLVTRKTQALPVCVSFGTDPHSNLERESDRIWASEVRRAGDHVAFSVCGGDLGYIGADNADKAYTSIAKYTREFPGTLIHVIGNHDIPGFPNGGWSAAHELAGHGAFTKYLGPVRWSFDYAGIHFIGMNWPFIKQADIDWLDRDLAAQPKDRPCYVFVHMWGPFIDDALMKYPNLKLVLCGHSHRNIFAFTVNQTDFWTKMSLYTLLYVDKQGYQFVDRCTYQAGRTGWDQPWNHHGRACALAHEWPHVPPLGEDAAKGETHHGLKDVTLNGESRVLQPLGDATYDVRWGARGVTDRPAKRFGLRITGEDGTVQEFVYDAGKHTLNLMGLETYFNPEAPHIKATGRPEAQKPEEQKWTEMRIFVMPDRIRVLVNSRVHYQKFLPGAPLPWGALEKNRPPKPDPRKTTGFVARKIEFFAEGAAAEFGRVDVWPRQWNDYKPRRQANSG